MGWEDHKSTIVSLYKQEGKKLSEVADIMKRQHGFDMSISAYKKKLNAWGLNKNIKAVQKSAALRVLRDMRAQGAPLPNEFEIGGQSIRRSMVERYAKAKDKESREGNSAVVPLSNAETPGSISLVAPVTAGHSGASPVSPRPVAHIPRPFFNNAIESLVFDINQYYTSYFAGTQPPAGEGTGQGLVIQKIHPQHLLDQYTASVKMLNRGYNRVGFQLLGGLHIAKSLFEGQHPRLLGCLVVMARTGAPEVPGLYKSVWGYIFQTASEVLGYQHPVAQLCRFLRDSPEASAILENLFRLNADLFETYLGSTHDKTLRAKLNLLDLRLQDPRNHDIVRKELDTCLGHCETQYGSNDVLTRTILYRYGWIEERKRNYGNAQTIYRDIIRRSDAIIETGLRDRIGPRVRVRLAAMLGRLGDDEDAGLLLREALRDSIRYFGNADYETCVILSTLADHLKKQGAVQDLEGLKRNQSQFFYDN
ncbi:hypothetical protein PG996_004546 [Apiospora saccharicola]|uniref:Clr5 domain-containing protein n=1 Tax=Apiospora saccharicola TaxID=335842 RepID=A0ABR1W4E8_9PEZI